jgi:hypothetical protein
MNVTPEQYINEKLGDKQFTHSDYPMSRQEIAEWIKEFIDISETNGDIAITTNKPNTKSNLPLHIVSEPLEALKKIVLDNTIELLGLTANNQYTHDLKAKTEFAIKSIEAIK